MKRSSWVVSALAVTVVALAAWFLLVPRAALPANLLGSVPYDAAVVLRLRASKVVRSEAFHRLVEQRGKAPGFARLTRLCGFHPLHDVDTLVVFAEPSGDPRRPRVAAAARGKLDHARLIDCLGKLGRGGMRSLTRENVHGIETVRNKKGTARAAFVGREGVLLGDAQAVSASIAALTGEAQSALLGPLSPLYAELPENSDLALVADVRGHEALLQKLLGALGVDHLISADGVVALAASSALQKDGIAGQASVTLQDASLARALSRDLERARSQLLDMPALSLTGFAAPLRKLSVVQEGARVTLRGEVRLKVAEAALELLPLLSALRAPRDRAQVQTGVPDAGTAWPARDAASD